MEEIVVEEKEFEFRVKIKLVDNGRPPTEQDAKYILEESLRNSRFSGTILNDVSFEDYEVAPLPRRAYVEFSLPLPKEG